jgi:hypothetical protein
MAYVTLLALTGNRESITAIDFVRWLKKNKEIICTEFEECDFNQILIYAPDVIDLLVDTSIVSTNGDVGVYMITNSLMQRWLEESVMIETVVDNVEVYTSDSITLLTCSKGLI